MQRPRGRSNFQQHPHLQWRQIGPRGFQQRYRAPALGYPAHASMPMVYKEEHWCETCDRGFPTLCALDKHKQQHQKCNIDGCQFVAHPKVITKHIQMQHSSGLFKKIANLNNPEEVKKWIEERKKKYPTKVNVERKAAEIKEKNARGEKMQLQRNTKSGIVMKRKHTADKQNHHHHQNKKVKQNNANVDKFNHKKKIPKKEPKELPALEDDRKIKPFPGIRDLFTDFDVIGFEEYEHSNDLFDDADDDKELQQESVSDDIEPKVCGALSSLICNYGSSDEEINTERHTQNDVTLNQLKQDSREVCNNHFQTIVNPQSYNDEVNKNIVSENDSGPEEIKVGKTSEVCMDSVTEKSPPVKKTINVLKRNPHPYTKNVKSKLPSTLLQKLLRNEIKKERNTILQCIRYIIKNNYFKSKGT